MDTKQYTTEEAARLLNVSPSRVRQMIIDGTLKTERFGRAHVITNEAIEAVRGRKTKPGPETKAQPSMRATNGVAKKASKK